MKNLLYNGNIVLKFDDKKHVYEVNDEIIPGVTSVTGVINKPALVGWAASQTANYVENRLRYCMFNQELMDDALIKDIVGKAKRARFFTSKKATDIGTAAHNWIEEYIKYHIQDDSELFPDYNKPYPSEPENNRVENAVNAFLNWCDDHDIEWIHAERKIFSSKYKYAGTVDIVAKVDNELVVIDIKGFPLDTKIPTPTGWTTIEKIQVGDKVFDRKGNICNVTTKSNIRERQGYRITFDDGSSIVADDDHKWIIRKKSGYNITDQEIIIESKNLEKGMIIENSRPINLPDEQLPIDPYVLGVWMGDGTKLDGKFTCDDIEIVEEIQNRGYKISNPHGNDSSKTSTRCIYGLRTLLKKYMILGTRNIPHYYLRGSITQRLDLLRGLMDSDGHSSIQRKQAIFTSTDKNLAKQVYELVGSLGELPVLHEGKYLGFGVSGTKYSVVWRPTRYNPFYLERKSNNLDLTNKGYSWRRMISKVEPTLIIRSQCIEVDSKDSSYLIGENFIPTHNTSKAIYEDYGLQVAAYVKALEEELGYEIHKAFILRIDKITGESEIKEFSKSEIDECFEIFKSCLKIYKWKE